MSNMSYCRFQNTADDLADCLDNIEDDNLSPEEEKARRRLVRLCAEILDAYGEEDGE